MFLNDQTCADLYESEICSIELDFTVVCIDNCEVAARLSSCLSCYFGYTVFLD